MVGRIVIENIRPSTPSGDFPAKAAEGERFAVTADIFRDGHDRLAAEVRYRPKGQRGWQIEPMHPLDNDRWMTQIRFGQVGQAEFQIRAWTDLFATWLAATHKKLDLGMDIALELEEGAALLGSVHGRLGKSAKQQLDDAITGLKKAGSTQAQRFGAALTAGVAEVAGAHVKRPDLTSSAPMQVTVDRRVSVYGAWYEFFPRSEGGLASATKRLERIADMGFDVVYLPPIHPIGKTDRKGRNNTTKAQPGDPGSPWAIGSEDGGHSAIEPSLGTFDDFDAFVEEAHSLGMEVALDYALQCSPDHPWVRDHPGWFVRRPDGSIRFAENPPKKYQDIYPIDFWTEEDREGLWEACLDIFRFWADRGVKIFRVDNPHTKPLAFWEWAIAKLREEHPDVVLLSEAFTRPKMMSKLAEVGFNQSYTYFTWRNTKQELTDYVTELAHSPKADYMRPTFWTNTPDILSGPLRNGSPDAFKMRFVLAATLVPSYGVYSGFELCENEPASDENEEYLNSEKYEIKHRDWDRRDSLAPYITKINDIRRRHLAFRWLRNIHFHHADNPNVIAYSRTFEEDAVLMVVNLFPDVTAESTIWLDMWALGLPQDAGFEAFDELTGQTFPWKGSQQYVRLDPGRQPAHILHLRPAGAGADEGIVASSEEGRPPEIWKG